MNLRKTRYMCIGGRGDDLDIGNETISACDLGVRMQRHLVEEIDL